MRSFALSAGRKAAAATMAGASVAAGQPSAQARELAPQTVPEHRGHASLPRKHLDEDWGMTDLDHEQVLIFKPYSTAEVDAAAEQVEAMMRATSKSSGARGGVSIEVEDEHAAPGSPASSRTDTTLGADADTVLEEVMTVYPAGQLQSAQAEQMHDLLRISSKLLQSPGLQREVFKCMVEDPEVRELMLRQSVNIDAYLTAVGIHSPTLLPAPESSGSSCGSHPVNTDGQPKDTLAAILDAMAACIDKTGSALAGLGGWLRDRVTDLAHSLSAMLKGPEQQDAAAATASGEAEQDMSSDDKPQAQQQRHQRPRNTADTVLGGVMVVAVALLCVLIARRPLVIRTAAAAAMGAAGAAHSKQRRVPRV